MNNIGQLISKEYKKLLEANSMEPQNIREHKAKAQIKKKLGRLMEAVEKNKNEIDDKLEEVRQELLSAGRIVNYGGATNEVAARPQCRLPLETVSKLIECPINELMLHFLNGQRLENKSCMVEYSQGNVLFYGPRYEHAAEDEFDYTA